MLRSVRAALCGDAYSAHVGAKAEGMNVLVLSLHSLLEEQAQEVVDAYARRHSRPGGSGGRLAWPRRLQRVFSHIRENIARDLTVSELAQVVGMSQYYFSKLFKMSTGTTPHQYVMRQRVERARRNIPAREPNRTCRSGHPGWIRDPKPISAASFAVWWELRPSTIARCIKPIRTFPLTWDNMRTSKNRRPQLSWNAVEERSAKTQARLRSRPFHLRHGYCCRGIDLSILL